MNLETKITLETEDGESVEFFVMEETRQNGVNYLLVTDAKTDEDGDGYILKDTSKAEESEAVYEFVDDEQELEDLFKIFTQLLDDVDVELQR